MNFQTLRIIDANLDRATEGLRVLEDIARFVLDDIHLSGRLKALRHSIHQAYPDISIKLISARNSLDDVGRQVEHQKEPGTSFSDTVIAIARRAEQSLRVLEETSRLADTSINGSIFEESRYAMYGLEKDLISRLSRRDKSAKLDMYAMVENETQFSEAVEHKITAIQFNPEIQTQREYYFLAKDFRDRCSAEAILLIIGEHLGITIASDADGVTLDANSIPMSIARGLLKIDQLIGYSAKSPEEAIRAESCGADYILCPESIKEAVSLKVRIPVISPINEEDL